jgi:hypothetical protein
MNRVQAPGYNLFKLVVTLILATIIFILLLRGCTPAPVAPLIKQLPTASLTPTPQPTKAVTQQPPSVEPTATGPAATTAAPTSQPEPSATPTRIPKNLPANSACPGAAASRLKAGDKVRVLANLNMRAAPGLHGAWIVTNTNGTELEIVGGPACTNIDRRAYEWWRVRRADGKEGWSAEASLNSAFYFLEPIP